MLILNAVVSYRSIPKILNLFNTQTTLQISWIPHFTAVINWVNRVGVGMLKEIGKISEPWIAIIDHSINIGTKKVLVVLRVKMDVLSQKGKAISLQDCECIGIKICEIVNGETIAKDLKDIFTISGPPNAIIKDGDHTLNKGVFLFIKQQDKKITIIDDISHVVANALKKQFEKKKNYITFTTMLKESSARLRQTAIAFLTPPKLRNKARFQNVSRLGKWGERIMGIFTIRGRAKKGSVLERLRKIFPNLSRLKPFIKNFAKTTVITSKVMEILKNRGLEKTTYDECMLLLNTLPRNSKTAKLLRKWLKKHIKIQQELTIYPMLVSTDIVESLFGKYKYIIKRSPQTEVNRSVLIIPALCGNIDEHKILKTLESTNHQELKNWEEENVGDTMRTKRLDFFDNVIQKVVKN